MVTDEWYLGALAVVGEYIKQKAYEIVPGADMDTLREADVLPDILETIYIDIDTAVADAVGDNKE